MLKNLASLLLICTLALCATTASAQVCDSKVSNRSINPSQPVFTAAAIWLQWLNNGTYSCAQVGNANHVRCSRGSTWYDAILAGCTNTTCTVNHYDANSTTVIRDRSVFTQGAQTWNFTFDGGVTNGWVTYACLPNLNNLQQPCTITYGTCIQ